MNGYQVFNRAIVMVLVLGVMLGFVLGNTLKLSDKQLILPLLAGAAFVFIYFYSFRSDIKKFEIKSKEIEV